MIGRLQIKSPWSQLFLLLGLFGIISQVNAISIFSTNNTNLEDPYSVYTLRVIQAVWSVVVFVLPAFIFVRIAFTGNYSSFLGFKKADKMNMYVLAIIGILIALPFVFWIGDLNQRIPMPESLSKLEEEAVKQTMAFLKMRKPADIIVNVIVMALIPAIAEELFFRGVLQRIIINITRNAWAGIVITAVLFSALHLQFQGFFPRLALGIMLGAFYWYSGSIWTCILAHFAINAVQVLVATYMPTYVYKNHDNLLLYALVSGLAASAIVWYYQRQSGITYAKVYKPNDSTPYKQFPV